MYRSVVIWNEASSSRMAAAMTYFTMLSLAPLLTMAIAIAGFVFGDQLAETEIVENVKLFTTESIAQTVAGLIKNAAHPDSGFVAGAVSISILVFAASCVFSQLSDTFNEIWQVPREKTQGILRGVQQRLFGIVMVICVGLLLLVAVVTGSVLGFFSELLAKSWPLAVYWLNLFDKGFSFLALPAILSLVFWIVPATKVRWRDAWPAGILTAVLIGLSRYLIQAYLNFSTTSEVYGAAGSLVALLIWVYMTAMIVFFGAAFSRAWSQTYPVEAKIQES